MVEATEGGFSGAEPAAGFEAPSQVSVQASVAAVKPTEAALPAPWPGRASATLWLGGASSVVFPWRGFFRTDGLDSLWGARTGAAPQLRRGPLGRGAVGQGLGKPGVVLWVGLRVRCAPYWGFDVAR